MKRSVVKEIELVEGKWVASERNLNDEGENAQVFDVLVLRSADGLKKVSLKLDGDGVLKVVDEQNAAYRVLLSGITSQCGEVEFVSSKIMVISFVKQFGRKPSVVLTLGDDSNSPVYRVSVTKTGFTIKFQNNFTGIVQWQATEA